MKIDVSTNRFQIMITIHISYISVLDVSRSINSFLSSMRLIINLEKCETVLKFSRVSVLPHHLLRKKDVYTRSCVCWLKSYFIILALSNTTQPPFLIFFATYICVSHSFPVLCWPFNYSFQRFLSLPKIAILISVPSSLLLLSLSSQC